MKTHSTENQPIAVAFYRVSTDKQNNERQYEDVRKYCKAYSYTIVKEFEEIISGASKLSERKELKAMLAYVDQHKPKYVICSELSRLARSADALTIIKDWTEKGICFITLKENIRTLDAEGKTNPMTTLLLNIMNALNIFELETIRYRVKSGLSKTVNNGNWSGGVPFGYTLENKRLVINKEQAEWVKLMFSKYAEGWGSNRIASHLNRNGLTTQNGKYWREAKVYKILSNSVYIGKRTWNDDVLEQPELKFIEESTFATVQQRLSTKTNTSNLNKQKVYNYILSGKIVCSCGQHMVGQGSLDRYICRSAKYAAGCGIKPIKRSWLEEQVKQKLMVNHSKLLTDNKKIIDNTASLEAELTELTSKIEKEKTHQNYLINSISRIGEQKFNEKFDASKAFVHLMEKRVNEINIKLKANQQFAKLIIPPAVAIIKPEFEQEILSGNKKVFTTNIFKEVRIDKELVQAAVDKIDIDNDSIKVRLVNGNTFNLPRPIRQRGRQPKITA